MKHILVTIDGGTTNTRFAFWNYDKLLLEEKIQIGIRDVAIKKSDQSLKMSLKNTLEKCLMKLSCSWKDISAIIASGMLTSKNGLCEIPYIQTPVSLENLAENMYCMQFPDVCPKPIWLIPGIKNATNDEICGMDMMRGEEVESIELLEKYYSGCAILIVLPGSHNKMIEIDEKKNICKCLTSMSGETLSALANCTILASALGNYYVNDKVYSETWILKGAKNAIRKGVCRAAFEVRIQEIFENRTKEELANYLMGVIISQDILAIKNSGLLHAPDRQNIIISGKNTMVDAWNFLFTSMMPGWKVIVDRTPQLSGRGAKRIFEFRMR